MLKFVARTLPDANLLIVATYRDTEAQHSCHFTSTVVQLSREAPHLSLRGLTESEVSEFVKDRSGVTPAQSVVATITQVTAGNPLFLDGVVRMILTRSELELTQPIQAQHLKLPDSQRMAIMSRLGRLSAAAQSMLRFAAVLGNEFEFSPLETVSGFSRDGLLELLDEVIAAGLMRIVAPPDRYRFAHALIRASIYDSIGSGGRIALHQHVGEWLEELYRSNLEAHVSELAHHFTQAARQGEARKAIDYSIRAAEACDRALAYSEAFTLRESALKLLENDEGNARKRAFLFAEMGRVGGLSGRGRDEISGYYESAIDIYAELNDRAEEARARFNLGTQLAKGDDESYLNIGRARAELTRAEAVAVSMSDARQLGRIRGALALAAWQGLDPQAGLETTANAMSAGLDEFWFCTVSNFRAINLLHSGRIREAFEQFEIGAKQARVASDPLTRFRSAVHAGNLHVWSWQPDTALRGLEAAIVDLMLSRGSLQHQMLSRLGGQAAVMIGNPDRARGFLRDGPSPLLEGQLALYAGEWDRAHEVLADGVNRMREAGARAPLCHYLFWFARVALANKSLHGAESLLREGAQLAFDARALLFEMLFRPELASVYTQMERFEEARLNLERCREITLTGENWYGLAGHLARAQGEFAGAQGDFTSATLYLNNAIDIFRKHRLPWEEALALTACSAAAARHGDQQTALHRIDAASAIYRGHGAGPGWMHRVSSACEVSSNAGQREKPNSLVEIVCSFQREGAIWTISHRNRTFRIKDMKGLRYIAHLMEHRGQEFHVLDLISAVEGVIHSKANGTGDELRVTSDLGDAGEILDARSKGEYRRRRDELRAELDEAEGANDRGRAERVRAELEMIEDQLASAFGLGGRDRKAAAHSERARDRVRKSIHKSLTSICEHDPSLGKHLTTCIRTGYVCAYSPDPASC